MLGKQIRLAGALAILLARALATPRSQAPGAAQPTFRGEVSLVEVSAVVTLRGVPVADLRRDEFRVFDDGAQQALVAFEYVNLTTTSGPAQRRDFVLVLDDLHVAARDTKAAQDVALAFVDALGPHDRLAIVNTSPHELVMQFSLDRDKARALVRKFRGQKGPPIPQLWDLNTRVHLQVIRNVALAMKGDPAERRAVLVISEGQVIEPEGASREPRIWQDYRSVVKQAALSNIAIYGIDPRGLVAPQPAMGESFRDSIMAGGSGAAGAEAMVARRYGSIGLLADSTGGQITIDHNALDSGIPRLLQDSRQYYRLAYVQPDIAPGETAKPRSIHVKVLREGVEVRARNLYLPR